MSTSILVGPIGPKQTHDEFMKWRSFPKNEKQKHEAILATQKNKHTNPTPTQSYVDDSNT